MMIFHDVHDDNDDQDADNLGGTYTHPSDHSSDHLFMMIMIMIMKLRMMIIMIMMIRMIMIICILYIIGASISAPLGTNTLPHHFCES